MLCLKLSEPFGWAVGNGNDIEHGTGPYGSFAWTLDRDPSLAALLQCKRHCRSLVLVGSSNFIEGAYAQRFNQAAIFGRDLGWPVVIVSPRHVKVQADGILTDGDTLIRIAATACSGSVASLAEAEAILARSAVVAGCPTTLVYAGTEDAPVVDRELSRDIPDRSGPVD